MSETETNRVLRAALARLPLEIAPQRDLWAGIQPRIAQCARSAYMPRRRALGFQWAVAACVLCSIVGAALAMMWQHRYAPLRQVAAMPAAPTPAAPTPAARLVPVSTDAVRDRLRAAAAAQLANLPHSERLRVESDLSHINSAVADLRAALAKDPANTLLQDLLIAMYQDELNTLANVESLASSAKSGVTI